MSDEREHELLVFVRVADEGGSHGLAPGALHLANARAPFGELRVPRSALPPREEIRRASAGLFPPDAQPLVLVLHLRPWIAWRLPADRGCDTGRFDDELDLAVALDDLCDRDRLTCRARYTDARERAAAIVLRVVDLERGPVWQ